MTASSDRRVLSRLMWLAGYVFLVGTLAHFELPRALAEEFLASDDYDELLAGIKGIRYSSASTSEIIAHFVTVMERTDWEEKCAGLYQLHQVVGDNTPGIVSATEQSELDRMLRVLADIASNAPHDHDRDVASQCIPCSYGRDVANNHPFWNGGRDRLESGSRGVPRKEGILRHGKLTGEYGVCLSSML